MEFIGRERELARIKKTLKAREQRNVLVYGRRRVGKSELIKQALIDLSDTTTIYYECRQTSEADNLESLSALAAEALGFRRSLSRASANSSNFCLPRPRTRTSYSFSTNTLT